MILRDGIVLLEFADLVNEACLSLPMYKHAVRDGKVTVVQKGGGGHPALIDWSSLPERYQALVRAHLGRDPLELAKLQGIERHLVLPADDNRYLDEYRAGNGLHLPDGKRAALKKAAAVLAMMADMDEVRRSGGTPAVAARYGLPVMAMKAAILDYIRLQQLDLPTSYARLERRRRAYQEARKDGLPGASTLVHGNAGNRNSSKLYDELQSELLLRLASRHQNHSVRRIATDYNLVAQSQGWPAITPGTVANYLRKGSNGRVATYYAKGLARYTDTYNVVVHRSRPSSPTLMWVADGHTYELYYQREVGGKASWHHRKTVVVVLDPHCWYPVGYAIGDQDNTALIREALKNAVAHMRELCGDYLLPNQLQTDNLGRSELAAWCEAMGVHYTPAKARLARAKVIEPYFAHHDRKYVQDYPNYSGHNIDARKENQPNRDALERLKRDFPTEAGVIAQIHEAFARERAEKHQAMMDGLASLPAERRKAIGRALYLQHFGTVHGRAGEPYTNLLTNRGVCPTIGGVERHYNLLTAEFQEHVGTEFTVVYDPADLSTVLVSARDGQLRFLVEETALVPMALADHTPETRRQLARVEAFKKELGQAVLDRPLQNAQAMRRLADGILASLQLTASASAPKERGLEVTDEQEAVVRSYAKVRGSHKKALQELEPPPPPNRYDALTIEEIRKRAIDQL